MKFRLSLADKISMTIIIVGVFGIMLIYYISNSYKAFAYQHHTQSIQQLAYLEADDLIEDLKKNSLDLALSIENSSDFDHHIRYKHGKDLTQQLDNQFYQYFVTAGVIKLLKLYILDTDFTLLSTSTEGLKTDPDSQLICPQMSSLAMSRQGSEKLQTLSRTCLYKNHPVFAVIVPFGGLNPKGYIQVITDLAYNLQDIDKSLAMPIQMSLLDDHIIYQSRGWSKTLINPNFLNIDLPIKSEHKTAILNIRIRADMAVFNKEVSQQRNWVMALAFVSLALTVFIVLLILQRSAIPPLARIYQVLEKIHVHSHDGDKNNSLLFEQLLEQIINLRLQSKTCFSVMIIDLTHFQKINIEFGNAVGDKLLMAVEERMSSILRDSDMISWVGTDSPGHKLLPSDTATRYRATIARLGGDEFGLVLPSAQSEEQAIKVASRIIVMLNQPFEIDGHDIDIRCRIGISLFPDNGQNEKILIRNADKAMHMAKSTEQDYFVFQASQQNTH